MVVRTQRMSDHHTALEREVPVALFAKKPLTRAHNTDGSPSPMVLHQTAHSALLAFVVGSYAFAVVASEAPAEAPAGEDSTWN